MIYWTVSSYRSEKGVSSHDIVYKLLCRALHRRILGAGQFGSRKLAVSKKTYHRITLTQTALESEFQKEGSLGSSVGHSNPGELETWPLRYVIVGP